MKKVIRDAQPTIKVPQTKRWLHPRLADSMKPYATSPKPTVATSAPVQSIFPRAVVLLSGTRHSESPITTAARGTLMKNAQRQEACSINHPPRIGPMAVVIAVKPDHVPMARPRSFSPKEALMIDRLPGTRNAAPKPWSARAITSWWMFGARPQPTEATAKTVTPTRNILLRPNRSPNEPPTRINAPRNNPYASTTHWMSMTVPPRLLCSAGKATFTTVLSMNAMLDPSIAAARI